MLKNAYRNMNAREEYIKPVVEEGRIPGELPDEVSSALRQNGKVPGNDGVTSDLLKLASES